MGRNPFSMADMFQSTHPHGVRLMILITYTCLYRFNPRTHTGCDNTHTAAVHKSCCFNPRTHTGCDNQDGHSCGCAVVSIHAPTRGATVFSTRASRSSCSFNPRTHTGCDDASLFGASCLFRFQSTHPHGVRPSSIATKSADNWFQSTHPHGVRLYTSVLASAISTFQSTHPHGVRRKKSQGNQSTSLFQSTHPHGVRRLR